QDLVPRFTGPAVAGRGEPAVFLPTPAELEGRPLTAQPAFRVVSASVEDHHHLEPIGRRRLALEAVEHLEEAGPAVESRDYDRRTKHLLSNRPQNRRLLTRADQPGCIAAYDRHFDSGSGCEAEGGSCQAEGWDQDQSAGDRGDGRAASRERVYARSTKADHGVLQGDIEAIEAATQSEHGQRMHRRQLAGIEITIHLLPA